jgi:hypothetical protein
MSRLDLSLCEHYQHRLRIRQAHELIVHEFTFFTNRLGKRHFVTMALKRSLKALTEVRSIQDDIFYLEVSNSDVSRQT